MPRQVNKEQNPAGVFGCGDGRSDLQIAFILEVVDSKMINVSQVIPLEELRIEHADDLGLRCLRCLNMLGHVMFLWSNMRLNRNSIA